MNHSELPWRACGEDRGGCVCGHITNAKDLVATVTRGKWGDDYPSIRLVGGSLDRKAEAYMEQITYGEIDDETAKANAAFIVKCCNNFDGLLESLKRMTAIVDSDACIFPHDQKVRDKAAQSLEQAKEAIRKAEEGL